MIKRANKSCRSEGAVGRDPLCYRELRERQYLNTPFCTVLDFGAGKNAVHTKKLREEGWDIDAYEFGANVTDEHIKEIKITYDIVIASNVLNILNSNGMLVKTLNEIANAIEPGGILICNYPANPRYLPDVDGVSIKRRLLRRGFEVEELPSGTKKGPVFICKKVDNS